MPTSQKNKKRLSFHLESPSETRRWGQKLAHLLEPGDIVALTGPLGAGKTTLVQGVAAGWGYSSSANSPTFALVNEYHTSRGELFHMDMFRLSRQELDAFPLEDYWDGTAVCLVEWADRVRARWQKETLEICLKIKDQQTREIEIVRPSPAWRRRLKPWR